jgi:CDP-diacylglycerol--glycerol-3-phosphate 3-phosphatidyltransferase
MKIGLYQLKYPARKWIEWVLPFLKNVSPNKVSLLMLPVGVAIALSSYAGLSDSPIYLLIAFFLCIVRMFLGTLDGLIAVRFKKESPSGELLNRLAPELCDMMYLIAILAAKPDLTFLGIFLICLAWLTSFSGMLGPLVGRTLQSIGPVGQTDRLAAFLLLLLLQYFFASIDLVPLFIGWCIGGGMITISLRLWRTFYVSSSI